MVGALEPQGAGERREELARGPQGGRRGGLDSAGIRAQLHPMRAMLLLAGLTLAACATQVGFAASPITSPGASGP